MSYQQTFRPDLNLVVTRFGRALPLVVARQCAIDTFRDPAYKSGMRELYDLRQVLDPDPKLGFDSIQEIWQTQSTWIQELRRRSVVVMVASSDLMYGLVRIYASLAAQGGLQVTPCRDWHTACRLLRVDAEQDLLLQVAKGRG